MSSLRELGARGWHSGVETLGGFQKFILRGNVVDLAVGIMIGAAFSGVVNALVKDILTPLIPIGKSSLATLKYTMPGTGAVIAWGDFVNTVISFLILAAVIYFFIVLPVTKLQDRFTMHKEPPTPTTRDCPFCLSTVPLKATRCAYCTAQLPPAQEPAPQTATSG
jgi:large conductance mechanosensitive channel